MANAVEIEGARKASPVIESLGDPFGDDRIKITEAYDARDPKFIHSWIRAGDADAGTLTRLSAEIVKDGENEVRQGGDLLIRRPKDKGLKSLLASEARSLKSAKKLAGDKYADYLVQKASPRRPVRKKQDEEKE